MTVTQIRSPRSALSLVLLAAACAEPADGSRDGPFRHIVLISLDTTRADHLDPYGATRPTTPCIAALAERGVLFEQVLTPAPTTLSAHTSIMTGRYPPSHGVPRNGFVVNPQNLMLAELLAQQGFHTAAFLGSFALGSTFGFDQGFDTFDERFDVLAGAEGGAVQRQNQRRADRVTDALLAHIDGVDAERMFLFAHYFDAHQPYAPPAPFDRRFSASGALQAASARVVGQAIEEHARRITGQPVSVRQLVEVGLDERLVEEADGEPSGRDQELADLYAGEVSFVDQEIGRLLDGLEQRGLLADALILLTGDHGETFWEHGDTWNHGLWVYETTVRVPLILCFPDGRGAGRRVAEPVSTIDIVPTLCELLGIEPPRQVQGTSLVPALAGRPFERGPVFSQTTLPLQAELRGDAVWRNALKPRCVRQGRWKVVQSPYLSSSPESLERIEARGLEQLFDLHADPGERTNLLRGDLTPEARAAYADLSAQLDQWARSPAVLPSFFDTEQGEEVRARLEQLGYAGSDRGDD